MVPPLRGPRPQDVIHLCLRYCKKITHFIISIAVLDNVPPDAGLQKRATFSTQNVGLAVTGNQTRATCVAGRCPRRSAIHYAFMCMGLTVIWFGTIFDAHVQKTQTRTPHLKQASSNEKKVQEVRILAKKLESASNK
jgi:hypothetical protein